MRCMIIVVLSLAMVAGGAKLAGASNEHHGDEHHSDWIPRDRLIQQLTAAGYSSITDLEEDEGAWEGKAVHDGKIVEFHADGKTGAILSEKPED